MNLEEFINLVSKRINFDKKKYTKAELKEIYKSMIDVIEDKLEEEVQVINDGRKKTVKVSIPLLGKFNIVRQECYYGKNPRTKEKVKVEANNRIYYSPYKKLKEIVNK